MHQGNYDPELESVLRSACMKDKTVILTTLNDAWAQPGSVFELFLESFRVGNQTQRLLNHLVVITYDQKTQARCLAMHKHCHKLKSGDNFTGEVFYMTPNYLHMMWKRLEFLGSILDMGYNFVFTVCTYTFVFQQKKNLTSYHTINQITKKILKISHQLDIMTFHSIKIDVNLTL